ncbi:hypothetical protein IAU60_005228 [Kwoniella sp. DSM 27419]
MDLLASGIDLAFLLLALFLIHRHGGGPSPPVITAPLTPSAPGSGLKFPTSPSPSSGPTPTSAPAYQGRFLGSSPNHTLPSIIVTTSTRSDPQSNRHLSPGTPSRPGHRQPVRPRNGHKRKSVSFSLSSMDPLHTSDETSLGAEQVRKRPPTPFFRPAKSPSILSPNGVRTPVPSILINGASSPADESHLLLHAPDDTSHELIDDGMPTPELTLAEMRHGIHVEDPMGVRKQWLMA